MSHKGARQEQFCLPIAPIVGYVYGPMWYYPQAAEVHALIVTSMQPLRAWDLETYYLRRTAAA